MSDSVIKLSQIILTIKNKEKSIAQYQAKIDKAINNKEIAEATLPVHRKQKEKIEKYILDNYDEIYSQYEMKIREMITNRVAEGMISHFNYLLKQINNLRKLKGLEPVDRSSYTEEVQETEEVEEVEEPSEV